MNIRIIEKMAGNSKQAKQLIEEYKTKVFSAKVKDVISDICDLEIPTDTYTEVKEKWDKDFDELLIKDIVNRWKQIEKKLNVLLKVSQLVMMINQSVMMINLLFIITIISQLFKSYFLKCCTLRLEMLSLKIVPQAS